MNPARTLTGGFDISKKEEMPNRTCSAFFLLARRGGRMSNCVLSRKGRGLGKLTAAAEARQQQQQ